MTVQLPISPPAAPWRSATAEPSARATHFEDNVQKSESTKRATLPTTADAKRQDRKIDIQMTAMGNWRQNKVLKPPRLWMTGPLSTSAATMNLRA